MKSLTIFTSVSQQLAARLFSRGRTQADKQRGASALEYVMLAAVPVGILAVVATTFGAEGEVAGEVGRADNQAAAIVDG